MGLITASIVSHGHRPFLSTLLSDLKACREVSNVIVTHNVAEAPVETGRPGWQTIIVNETPKGFSANHNAAFRHVATPYFLIINPDVHLVGNPFPVLLACMGRNNVALTAPAVVNRAGALEDSARLFPLSIDLILKALGRYEGRLHYRLGDPPMPAPWVAGMFMLLRSSDYAAVSGFDERFFLYYEDVDLCARLWHADKKIVLCPSVHVIHDARRASRRNLRHMRWHAASMVRYFLKYPQRPKVSTT